MRKFAVLLMATALASGAAGARPIDRKALVTRHNPVLAEVDKHAPLMIGNGDIAFTAEPAGPREAEVLGVGPGTALLVAERTTQGTAGAVTWVRLAHAPGHRVQLVF